MNNIENLEITQSNYIEDFNTPRHVSQLVLPIDYSLLLKEDDPIYSFYYIMDQIPLLDLEQEVKDKGRKPYDFSMMCKLVAFSYMQGQYSLRKIEDACVSNIRYHLLTNGQTPSYKTIGEFIKYRLGSNVKILLIRVVNVLKEEGLIDMSVAFIDGTKFQANANKYTFVWKKSVKNYLNQLQDKITKSINKLNDYIFLRYFSEFEVKERYTPEDIMKIMDWIMFIIREEGIELKDKSSKKKDPMQRFYMEFEGYEKKMLEYLEKIEICGERNSYSKTDHDATFMHLKEDYYGGTNKFHAAYNVQLVVSDEYITHIGVYDKPNDTKTFIPLMRDYKEAYGEMPLYPVADAGYGSYENYMFCIDNALKLVQKFNIYRTEHTKKYLSDIYNKNNWYRDEATGDYICPNWKRFKIVREYKITNSEYLRIDQIHSCSGGCVFCPLHSKCTDAAEGRTIVVNPILEEMREEVRKNLGSEQGKELKTRRSIEVEGAFGIIKNNWNYERIHRKGMEDVEKEMTWVAIGFNLRKFHNKRKQKLANIN